MTTNACQLTKEKHSVSENGCKQTTTGQIPTTETQNLQQTKCVQFTGN